MTNQPNDLWRQTPVTDILRSRWAIRLSDAGYPTAGDVLDASPEVLADRVYGVGPKRAVEIRDVVWAYVRPPLDDGAWDEIDPPTPEVRDTVATVVSLIVIGALFYFTARLLL